MRSRAAFLALAVPVFLALAYPRAGRADPAIPPLSAGIPAGIPISLDGVTTPAEWQDAATQLFSAAGPRLFVKQSRGSLLVAVVSDRPWPQGGRFDFYTRPGTGDGTSEDPGAMHLDFEPFQHDRRHALTTEKPAGAATVVPRDGVWVVRAAAHAERASLEAAAPLAALGITGKAPPPLKWLAVWNVPGSADSVRTVPAGLDLRGPVGKPPPGLASTAGWATASTWVEQGGAGAYRKTEWDAFLAADKELADRGERAHALVVSLLDETRDEEAKVDAHIERDVLENLRWIATKEPWTRGDVRAFAVGLWRLNRLDEAIATLGDAGSISDPAADRGQDLLVLARVAYDAERYRMAAQARVRLADSIGAEGQASPHRSEATRATGLQALLDAERAARAADAAKDDQPLVRLKTTRGDVYLRLLEDDAPESVAQFVVLCDEKTRDGKPFFSGLLWHRVVANGVAQTGDPTSRDGCAGAGAGNCAWYVDTEKTPRKFFRGSVGFALDRMNRVHSQFFVVTARKDSFDKGGYPCFATVIAGMDVVDRLEACDTLIGVEVIRRRSHVYEVKKKY